MAITFLYKRLLAQYDDDMNDTQLIKVTGDLTKPATELIKRVSDAIGYLYEPLHRVRMAKAEAAAALINEKAQIEITELRQRAVYRWVEELGRQQENIESIMERAIPMLDDQSTPEQMDNDWIVNFFDKSKNVSDKEMQQLWASILAGQANKSGSFSKRTINLLHDLEKADAELFNALCRYTVRIFCIKPAIAGAMPFTVPYGAQPFVFELDHPVYQKSGLNFSTVSHLSALGLVRFDNLSTFLHMEITGFVLAIYDETVYHLILPKGNDNLPFGKVIFTRAGTELCKVCKPEPVEGFIEYLEEKMPGMRELRNGEVSFDNMASHADDSG